MPNIEADLFWPSRHTESSLHKRATTLTAGHVPLPSTTGRSQETHSSMAAAKIETHALLRRKPGVQQFNWQRYRFSNAFDPRCTAGLTQDSKFPPALVRNLVEVAQDY